MLLRKQDPLGLEVFLPDNTLVVNIGICILAVARGAKRFLQEIKEDNLGGPDRGARERQRDSPILHRLIHRRYRVSVGPRAESRRFYRLQIQHLVVRCRQEESSGLSGAVTGGPPALPPGGRYCGNPHHL